jgi:hypothetical protein
MEDIVLYSCRVVVTSNAYLASHRLYQVFFIDRVMAGWTFNLFILCRVDHGCDLFGKHTLIRSSNKYEIPPSFYSGISIENEQ